MGGYLIDLFFSLKGNASRGEWLLSTIALAALAGGGILLFNDGSFDESMNANPDIPTMAAGLWALLCVYAFTALSTKRLSNAGLARWTVVALALAAFLLVCGWGAGYFLAPFSSSADTLVFWVLIAAAIPAIMACARQTTS